MSKFKLLSIFSTLVLCVGLTSCLPEDLEPETDLTSVVGEWENSGTQSGMRTTTTFLFQSNGAFEKNSSIYILGSAEPVENVTGTYTYNNETKILTMTSFIYGETVYVVTKLTTKEIKMGAAGETANTYAKI